MKICLLTHTFPRFAGDTAAPFMDGLARGIRVAGNEVFVLTPFSPRFAWKKNQLAYKIVTYKYIFPNFLHKLGYSETLTDDKKLKLLVYFLSPFLFLAGIIALWRLVVKEKIDVVNAHWILPNGFIAAVVSKMTGTPIVSTLPGSDVYMVRKNPLFSLMGKFAVNASRAVTSNSPQLLEDLTKIGIRNKNLHAIIYGVDPNKFCPSTSKNSELRGEYGIPKDNIIVLGVGRLVEKKGFKYLIQAAPKIISKYPKTSFFVVGEGDKRTELEELVRKNNLQNDFVMPGWVDYKSLVDYYNLGDIFILPSIRDAEGNLDDQSVAVVEAMACGKPIVTTNFPGYKIVVKEGENGFLVGEKDPNGIARVLKQLLNSSSLRNKMGSKSRELVLNNFTWPAIGRQYTKLFEMLV